jgi:hypothetical protein
LSFGDLAMVWVPICIPWCQSLTSICRPCSVQHSLLCSPIVSGDWFSMESVSIRVMAPETLLIRPFSRRGRVCGTSLDRKLVGYQQKLRFFRNILSQGSQALWSVPGCGSQLLALLISLVATCNGS